MRLIAALAISATTLLAQGDRAPLHSVTAVRNWSLPEVTRIAVEVTGDFHFKSDRLHNPERIYFDILNSRPRIDTRRIWSRDINDRLVQRVRVAETTPGTTRIVIDLNGAVEVTTSQLSNPFRLMVEVRPGAGPTIPTQALPDTRPGVPLRAEPMVKGELTKADPPRVDSAKPETARFEPPKTELIKTDPIKAESIKNELSKADLPKPSRTPVKAAVKSEGKPEIRAEAAVLEPGLEKEAIPAPREASRPAAVKAEPVVTATPSSPVEIGRAAHHTATGGSSLTRALGLKITRVVIDAGHGGHDQGTQGLHGLIEKELVLDVALRVGKLIEERMNAEVIYTRSDDTFIPLEGRTALANEKKADLFLSIHANSSPFTRISGVETFYLNFSDSKDALDVASRENASSQKSIFELQDIIHKITLHEKLDESREFAGRVQASLFSFASHNVAGQKNRGVKKAPFVVLIGAQMPSVLAEIGFVTNPREEVLLKKTDYRQKLAEALYRGVSKYAEGLSHFQMAQN
jgi:N-acetylmuramoyl-L-alanine amidase